MHSPETWNMLCRLSDGIADVRVVAARIDERTSFLVRGMETLGEHVSRVEIGQTVIERGQAAMSDRLSEIEHREPPEKPVAVRIAELGLPLMILLAAIAYRFLGGDPGMLGIK